MLNEYIIHHNHEFYLNYAKSKPKLAVAVSRELVRHLDLSSELYCFEKSEIIYEYALIFLARKDFLYIKELNRFIEMASESGLIEKWHLNNHIRHYSKRKAKIYSNAEASIFYGALIIAAPTEIFLLFLLFLEIITHKKISNKNCSRIWFIIEMLIDADRHFWLENKWH